MPDFPIKYYDLQGDSSIEFRFRDYVPAKTFYLWLEWLEKVLKKNDKVVDNTLQMLRVSVNYEAWSDDINFKKATHDRMFYCLNDWTLAFYQNNFTGIPPQNIESQNVVTNYFELTGTIEEDDFRVKLLEKIIGSCPILR